METQTIVTILGAIGGAIFSGVVGNAASDSLKAAWNSIRSLQQKRGAIVNDRVLDKAVDLATETQHLLAWAATGIVTLLTLLALLVAEVFLMASLYIGGLKALWLWLPALLALATAWLGWRTTKVLDTVLELIQ